MPTQPQTTEQKLKSELETYAAQLVEFADKLSDIAESEEITAEQIEFLQVHLTQRFLVVCVLPPTSRRELAECVMELAQEIDEQSEKIAEAQSV